MQLLYNKYENARAGATQPYEKYRNKCDRNANDTGVEAIREEKTIGNLLIFHN